MNSEGLCSALNDEVGVDSSLEKPMLVSLSHYLHLPCEPYSLRACFLSWLPSDIVVAFAQARISEIPEEPWLAVVLQSARKFAAQTLQ